MAQLVILSLLDTSIIHHWLVCRKVRDTIRFSAFPQLIEIINDLKLHYFFKINKTEKTITAKTGASIICVGLDDVQKLKSISGITDIWGEEASEFVPNDVEELDTRIRGNRPANYKKKIYLTFNPVNKLHWLKSYYFDRSVADCFIMKVTYKDNAFLDKEDIKTLLKYKEINPYRYQVYALGEWGDIGNTIFSNFRQWDFKDIPGDMLWGMDFGFNHPSAIIGCKIYDGELYIVEEFYKTGLTNTDLIAEAQQLNIMSTIMADSAEPDRIEEFNRAGFDCRAVKKGARSLLSGIDFLQSIKINISPKCVNTFGEISGYKWLEDKNGKSLDKPIPYNDDCLAAIRYAIEPVRLAAMPTQAVETIWR